MKFAHTGCSSLDCGRATDKASFSDSEMPGTRWRSALAALVNAPVRLHRFRNFHTAVLEDAIRAYDCNRPCGKDS